MADQLGDAPIESAYERQMREVARALDIVFNGDDRGGDRQTGFVLLVFPFGSSGGRCNYISRREDVVTLLEEQAKLFRQQQSDEG